MGNYQSTGGNWYRTLTNNEIERALQQTHRLLNRPKKLLIIHPKTHEQLSQKDRDFLSDNFSVVLYSCIKPTEAYVGSSDFLVECPIDSWEKA